MNTSRVHSQTCTRAVFVITFLALVFETLVSHFHMLFQMTFVVAREITFWAAVRNIVMYTAYVSFQVLVRVCFEGAIFTIENFSRVCVLFMLHQVSLF